MSFALISFGGAALLAAAALSGAPADSPFGAAAPVTDAELHGTAGRTDLSLIATANNRSVVTNNSVNGNSVTGTINISDTAFSDMQGLSVVSANTGNNVAINSSMVVNVAVRPES